MSPAESGCSHPARHRTGPQERRSQASSCETIAFNIVLPVWSKLRLVRWLPLVNLRAARSAASRVMTSLQVQAKSPRQAVSHLSGGNQQKVVIGRWLGPGSRVLLLDEPTRGVDVGARAEDLTIIRRLAEQGRAVLVISSEFDELLWSIACWWSLRAESSASWFRRR